MDFSHAIDISMPLNEQTVVWVDDPPPQLRPVLRQPEHEVNFTWLDFGAHAGTHVDAPFFLFADKPTADEIPLERLCGPCRVVDLTSIEGTITAADLAGLDLTERVLIRTNNSHDPMETYNPAFVDMDLDAAVYLVSQGVTTIGYDYQSFERAGANVLHRYLLERQITLIDNLRLANAPAGDYLLLCLPIKVTGIDAAPCRALLLPQ